MTAYWGLTNDSLLNGNLMPMSDPLITKSNIINFSSEIELGEVTTLPILQQHFPSQNDTPVHVIQTDMTRAGNIIIGTNYALFTIPVAEADTTNGELIVGNRYNMGK